MLCIFELTLFPPPLLGVGEWGVGLCAAAPRRPPDDSSVPPPPVPATAGLWCASADSPADRTGGWGRGGGPPPKGDIPDKKKFHPVTNGRFPPLRGGGCSLSLFNFANICQELTGSLWLAGHLGLSGRPGPRWVLGSLRGRGPSAGRDPGVGGALGGRHSPILRGKRAVGNEMHKSAPPPPPTQEVQGLPRPSPAVNSARCMGRRCRSEPAGPRGGCLSGP